MTPLAPWKNQQLETESCNQNTVDMDTLAVDELVRLLHAENYEPARAIENALPEIVRAVELISERLEAGGRLFYVGAGTSGRIGVLDASECPPTFGVDPELVQGIIAGGDFALRNSTEGAEDDATAGSNDLASHGVREGDAVIGIAASGRTPYVIGALNAARRAGAITIALVNVEESEMKTHSELTIAAITGPEPLTGSTRLKAGTAQKMALNLISTAVMVRLGKTYGNLMVDVCATNLKLRERAIRIVSEGAQVEREDAIAALELAGWHAKTAIVAQKLGLSAERASALLDQAGGHVRRALSESKG